MCPVRETFQNILDLFKKKKFGLLLNCETCEKGICFKIGFTKTFAIGQTNTICHICHISR